MPRGDRERAFDSRTPRQGKDWSGAERRGEEGSGWERSGWERMVMAGGI